MEPEQIQLFSLQAEIIRLIQTAHGQGACYATPINGECGKPECVWRNDCFDEARKLFPSLRMRETKTAESNRIPAEITRLQQAGDEQDTSAAKRANGKRKDWNCPLRSTCKMPAAYCKIGKCADWFF